MVAAGTPFEGVEHLLERSEETVLGTDGDAAANDDDFGVEDVDKGGDGGGEMADGGVPDFFGVLIARGIGIEQRMRGGVAAFAALGDGLVANRIFEAAGCIEVIARRVRIDAEVPEMAGAADFALHKLAATPDRATDAGAEREHEGILRVFSGSSPHFAEQGGVRVVEHPAVTFEEVGPREFFEAVHASGHPVDALAVRIRQTGCGEADGEPRA